LCDGLGLNLEDVLAGTRETHIFSCHALDFGGIALERPYVILQLLIFFVEVVDFLLNVGGLLLRAPHRDHAVRTENILQDEQGESRNEKPRQVAAKEGAHLLGEARASGVDFLDGGLLCAGLFPTCSPAVY
jgi:hypothetical protein